MNTLKFKSLLITIVLFFCGSSHHAYAAVLSIGPADNNSVFWIDQSQPNQNIPPQTQKWGLVFTVPSDEDMLVSASFYVSSHSGVGSSYASNFMVRMSEWSAATMQPIGLPIYESSPVLFSTPNSNDPDPIWGVAPTIFSVNSSVVAGNQYILEILGDGAVGMLTTTGYADGGLYLAQNSSTWNKFGNYALRSDITFGATSAVPLPPTMWLFSSGLAMIAWRTRRKGIQHA